ncbi:MAG: 16S rRNA (uracil(1498)-N(3))-methyltransferase [Rhodocyclaceae bacterium]|nr:16S rRNA (uracil(1498)-N(3))-methyltransferase [Rhodocyclaceae bacterium]
MIPRFFCPSSHARLAPGARFALPDEVAHHAVRVLRLKAGDEIILFDGKGGQWRARLRKVGPQGSGHVEVLDHCPIEHESPLAVTLVQALPESADKMDWIVEKAVELGAAAIQPVVAQRSVVRLSAERMQKRLSHWQAVATAACAQCGRNRIPAVQPLLPLADFLAGARTAQAMKLVLDPAAEEPLAGISPPQQEVWLLIGPEGGFHRDEMRAAWGVGFRPVKLGPRILRTETAGAAALAVMQALWGDFREDDDHVRDR